MSKELPERKRVSFWYSGLIGLSLGRNLSLKESKPSGVKIATHAASCDFISTSPSEKAGRSFAGTFSLFFASSVWSKCPRNFILRLREVLGTEVVEWEEPHHPGPVQLEITVTHLVPHINTLTHIPVLCGQVLDARRA